MPSSAARRSTAASAAAVIMMTATWLPRALSSETSSMPFRLGNVIVEYDTFDVGINPAVFEHSSGGPGIAFRVRFRQEIDALALVKAFGGWLNNRDDPDGAHLWHISGPPP
jgi:hypothetical protein